MPASERKPGTDQVAPDPAAGYGREKPEKEAGMGRLDNNTATPTARPDNPEAAVPNKQELRQLNAEDIRDASAQPRPGQQPLGPGPGQPLPIEQPDHSMLEEDPRGEDLAPMDIHDPRRQRYPRHEGKGGTP